MSSSHLFLGLPIALFVLHLELRSGFHSAVFFSHRSLGAVAILSANFHLVQCINSASLYVIDPVFFFNRSCIHILIWIVFKGHFTVHIIMSLCALTISAFIISAAHVGDVNFPILIFGLNVLFLNLLQILLVWIMSGSILRCVD